MERQRVKSANIASIGYDEDKEILEVEFQGGGVYQFAGVPQTEYQELMTAPSHGKYFAQHIKNHYEFKR